MKYLWLYLGYYREGIDLLKELFSLPDPSSPETRADHLQDASDLAWQVHDFETSLVFAREAAELGKIHNLPGKQAMYLNRLGRINIERGDYPEARRVLEECLLLAKENPAVLNPGLPLAQLGELALFEGRLEDAQSAFEKALELLAAREDVFIAMATVDLAEIGLATRDFDMAFSWLERAYPYASVNLRRSIVFLCAAAGYLALRPNSTHADLCAAVTLFGASEHLVEQSGVALGAFYRQLNHDRIQIIRQRLSAADYENAFAGGIGFDRPQVLSFARKELDIS